MAGSGSILKQGIQPVTNTTELLVVVEVLERRYVLLEVLGCWLLYVWNSTHWSAASSTIRVVVVRAVLVLPVLVPVASIGLVFSSTLSPTRQERRKFRGMKQRQEQRKERRTAGFFLQLRTLSWRRLLPRENA